MARDRKRAKQRRDRARRAAGTTAVTDRARRDEPVPSDLGGGARADVQDENEAPEPLDHASAEVDLANAQLAAGLADEGPYDGEEDDGFVAPDELEDEADQRTTPSRSPARVEAAAGHPAREHHVPGNRVVGFLQASWRELQRVQWPDRRQVAQATGVVLAFCIIAGVFLGIADELFGKLVDAIL